MKLSRRLATPSNSQPIYRCDWCAREERGYCRYLPTLAAGRGEYVDEPPEGWPNEKFCCLKCEYETKTRRS